MLECVLNVSEGRDPEVIDALRRAADDALLDLHSDPHHHRSVLTVVGEDAPRVVTRVAVDRIDLRSHAGAHPRFGAVDVVPFVSLGDTPPARAVEARDDFAAWAAAELELPVFLYGPERTLPDIRRQAFVELAPDHGPGAPHPTAGTVAAGARPPLVAYNVWLEANDLGLARQVAAVVRSPAIRALGLQVGDRVQVSMNLVAPDDVGPGEAYDAVAAGAAVAGAELVGLLPEAVLARVPRDRWEPLDLAEDRTIEARLAR